MGVYARVGVGGSRWVRVHVSRRDRVKGRIEVHGGRREGIRNERKNTKCNTKCHGQNRAHVELERTHGINQTNSNDATTTRVWEASGGGVQRAPWTCVRNLVKDRDNSVSETCRLEDDLDGSIRDRT